MTRLRVIGLVLIIPLTLTGCAAQEPTTTTTKSAGPSTTVKSRTVLKNMPGGEGKENILIRICWHGKSKGCGSYPPSKVTKCKVDAAWSSCKED